MRRQLALTAGPPACFLNNCTHAAQGTLAAQEPLLSVRRQLALLAGDTAEAGACWLQYARLCRTMGACGPQGTQREGRCVTWWS